MFIRLVLVVMEGIWVTQERMVNLAVMNCIQNLADQAEIQDQMEEVEAGGLVADSLRLQEADWAAAAAVAADTGRLAVEAVEQIAIIILMLGLAARALLA